MKDVQIYDKKTGMREISRGCVGWGGLRERGESAGMGSVYGDGQKVGYSAFF